MKKIALFLLISYCSVAFPTTCQLTGFYINAGLGAGWSDASQDQFTEVTGAITTFGISNAIETAGVAVSAALGYTFPYVSLEGKFTHVPDYTENDTGQLSQNGAFAGFLNSNAKSSLNYVSALGSFKIPIYRFHLLAGGGLAIVFKRTHTRKSTVSVDGVIISTTTQAAESRTFYRPEIVAGIGKEMTKHVACEVVYTRVFSESHIGVHDAARNFLPNINTLQLVASYIF